MKDTDLYNSYRKMLPVMKHRLDDELELHAQVYEVISDRVVICNSRMLEAKNTLASREDSLAENIRDNYEKLTKDAIEGKVRNHPERREAWNAYQDARAEYEKWAGLLEAWKQKGYSIKTLAELYTANYYAITNNSVGSRNPDDRPRRPNPPSASGDERDNLENRAAMRRSFNQQSASEAPTQRVRRRVDDE